MKVGDRNLQTEADSMKVNYRKVLKEVFEMRKEWVDQALEFLKQAADQSGEDLVEKQILISKLNDLKYEMGKERVDSLFEV